jgi:RecJ-like exonuclease
VRASRDKTTAAYRAIFEEEWDGLIVLDKGTSHAGELADGARRTNRPVIVLDHHNLQGAVPDGVTLVNPRASGLDGSRDASGATTAMAFALALAGPAAWPWGPVALSGAIGDWQHMGGWQGWNREVVEQSRKAGHLVTVVQPAFIAVTLAEAVARFTPAIPGVHGDAGAAAKFLESLGIDPDGEVEDLPIEEQARLVSACALRLLAAGSDGSDIARLSLPTEHDVRLGTSLRHVFRIVDACGRTGATGAGIAFLLGDKSAKAEALAGFTAYRTVLSAGVRQLREEGTKALLAVQYAWTLDPAYTGMVAGIGMTHILRDRRRPVALLALRPDGLVQASTRGNEAQVAAGMDLGRACQLAATAVGAEGGGHPIAAGAVIPADQADAFLAALDAALSSQGFLDRMGAA